MTEVKTKSQGGEDVARSFAKFYHSFQRGLSQFLHFLNFIAFKLFGIQKGSLDQHESSASSSAQKKILKSVKDMPGPMSLPVFGTTLTSTAFKSTNLFKANSERIKKYGSIVKEEYFWGFPMINLLDPDHIEAVEKALGNIRPGMEILMTYRNLRPDKYDTVGITNSNGQDWDKLHNLLYPNLASPKFINSMSTACDEIAQDFLHFVKSDGLDIKNFVQVIRKFVHEVSFYNVFGKRVGFIQEDSKVPENLQLFHQTQDQLWSALHDSAYRLPWWKYFPTKLWQQNKKNEDLVLTLMEDLLREYFKEGEGGGLLGPLMNRKDASYKTKRLLALEVLSGATDTVIYTITFMIYWISKHEQVASKLFEELKTLLPCKDSSLNGDLLRDLPYLKACMMECFRLSPVAPNISRLSEQPIEVGGYYTPPYTLFIMQYHYAAMQDSNFYKAKEFIPERWIYGGDDGNVPPFQPHRRSIVAPFGIGKRGCPGRRLARHETSIILARILRSFKVQVIGEIEPLYEWIVRPANPVHFVFTERDE